MTTIDKATEECAICGQTNEYDVLSSSNVLGPPDLDTRPSEMERATFNMWIQTCPSCGYCAPAISEQIENTSAVINSSSYLEQLNDSRFPELANAFLCYSLIQESIGKYDDAGRSSIHAAWVCDDEGLLTSAQTCRRRAVHLLQKAQDNNQESAEGLGVPEIIITDLLRRSGQRPFGPFLRFCLCGECRRRCPWENRS